MESNGMKAKNKFAIRTCVRKKKILKRIFEHSIAFLFKGKREREERKGFKIKL